MIHYADDPARAGKFLKDALSRNPHFAARDALLAAAAFEKLRGD